jgi:hypothetical protein
MKDKVNNGNIGYVSENIVLIISTSHFQVRAVYILKKRC